MPDFAGAEPVELATTTHAIPKPFANPNHNRTNSSDNYYEDVDPRFVEPQALPPVNITEVPSSLVPGYNTAPHSARNASNNAYLHPHSAQPDMGNGSDDPHQEIPSGSRSPATSDTSHFTSVSQRGVNPNWRPPPGMGPGGANGGAWARRPVPRQEDVILEANPDFALPTPGKLRANSMGAARARQAATAPSMLAGSRYPGAI